MSNPERPFGWRKRIGLLSPTVIETAAYDFYRLAPEGVSMCATTSNIEHWSRENFQQHVLEPIVTAVKYLASRNVDYIIHTGMPVVTTRGKGFEDELVKQIEEATGLPATTSIRSAIRALARLGVRKVAVVTPYPRELHESAVSFLAASGFQVVVDHTMDVVFKRLQDVTPAQIATTTREVLASAPTADGVYGGGRCTADRGRARNSGGDRRPCRLLGGVSLGRHPRPDRGSRETDAQSQRRGSASDGSARVNAFSGSETQPCEPIRYVR